MVFRTLRQAWMSSGVRSGELIGKILQRMPQAGAPSAVPRPAGALGDAVSGSGNPGAGRGLRGGGGVRAGHLVRGLAEVGVLLSGRLHAAGQQAEVPCGELALFLAGFRDLLALGEDRDAGLGDLETARAVQVVVQSDGGAGGDLDVLVQ